MLSNQDFFYSAAHLQGALKNGFGEAVMFHLLTVARRGSCGLARKLILLSTQSLVLCCKYEMQRSFVRHLILKAWILFSVSKQGPCFTSTEEDGGDKRLVELEQIKAFQL